MTKVLLQYCTEEGEICRMAPVLFKRACSDYHQAEYCAGKAAEYLTKGAGGLKNKGLTPEDN